MPYRHKEYHSNWVKLARLIRERDGHICKICGIESFGTRHHVHHIDYNPGNNRSENLVCLCEFCHKSVHCEGYRPYQDGNEFHPVPWGELENIDSDPEWIKCFNHKPKKSGSLNPPSVKKKKDKLARDIARELVRQSRIKADVPFRMPAVEFSEDLFGEFCRRIHAGERIRISDLIGK